MTSILFDREYYLLVSIVTDTVNLVGYLWMSQFLGVCFQIFFLYTVSIPAIVYLFQLLLH